MYGLNALQCGWAWWSDYDSQFVVREVHVSYHTSDDEHDSLLRLGVN
jgi:hypothetical protein